MLRHGTSCIAAPGDEEGNGGKEGERKKRAGMAPENVFTVESMEG